MQIENHVWIEEHTIDGRGVPFAPRTVYWVRYAIAGSRTSPLLTEVYSRRVATAVAKEQLAACALIEEQIIRDITASLTPSLTTLPAFRQN